MEPPHPRPDRRQQMTQTDKTEILLPCPFCGVRLKYSSEDGEYTHPIVNCLFMGYGFADKKSLIKAWNRRASLDQTYEKMNLLNAKIEGMNRVKISACVSSGRPGMAAGIISDLVDDLIAREKARFDRENNVLSNGDNV